MITLLPAETGARGFVGTGTALSFVAWLLAVVEAAVEGFPTDLSTRVCAARYTSAGNRARFTTAVARLADSFFARRTRSEMTGLVAAMNAARQEFETGLMTQQLGSL